MLKFDYRVIETSGFTPGVIEAQLKMAGASGWRLAFLLPNGSLVLELMGEIEADSGPTAPPPPPAVERITPQGEGLDEYLCGCSCGEIVVVPEKFRPQIVKDGLAPFKAGHGPHPEERTTYLARTK